MLAEAESAMRRLAGRRLYHQWKLSSSSSQHPHAHNIWIYSWPPYSWGEMRRGLCERDSGLQCSSIGAEAAAATKAAAASFEEHLPIYCCCTLHCPIHIVWSGLISVMELHHNLLLRKCAASIEVTLLQNRNLEKQTKSPVFLYLFFWTEKQNSQT